MSATHPTKGTGKSPLGVAMFWVVFATATITFSNWLATFKAFTVVPTVQTFLPLALASLILVISVGILVYDGYVKELQAGSLRRHVRLFDWIYKHYG